MFEIRKPKVGLAAVMCTPFRGDKEGNYLSDRKELNKLAAELDFELKVVENGIYDLPAAEKAAEELGEWGADFILLQTSSFASGDFLYPFTGLKIRLGLWSVPEGPPTSEGGLPLNSFTASNLYNSIIRLTLPRENSPVKWFFGHPGQPLFDQRLFVTLQALKALINLPGKRIALIGGVAPSFDNLVIDYKKPEQMLGVQILELDLQEVIRVADGLEPSQITGTIQRIQSDAAAINDPGDQFLEKTARTHAAIHLLAEDYGFEAVALSCWPQFQSDYGLAVCTVMGHLNTTGLIAACEGDLTSAISMLTLRYLTGGDVVTLMDLVTIDQEDESVLLWHCGPTSPALADEKGAALKPLWLFDGPDGRQTGLHNDLVLKPGQATVLGYSTDFENMLLLGGKIDNTKPSYRGSRGWFKDLTLNGSAISTADLVETIMASGYQHHYPFAYGNLVSAGLELCAWLDIHPLQVETYSEHVR